MHFRLESSGRETQRNKRETKKKERERAREQQREMDGWRMVLETAQTSRRGTDIAKWTREANNERETDTPFVKSEREGERDGGTERQGAREPERESEVKKRERDR